MTTQRNETRSFRSWLWLWSQSQSHATLQFTPVNNGVEVGAQRCPVSKVHGHSHSPQCVSGRRPDVYINITSTSSLQSADLHTTMTVHVIWLALALMATAVGWSAVHAAPKENTCAELEKPCHDNSECCGGCCKDNKCAVYSDSCVSAHDPCHLYDCPVNKVCYLAQVQCLQSPCQPIPACKPADSDYD